jgi:hypothetical protein
MSLQHQQIWVKVNAEVDKGMARIVSALSSLGGLRTLQSCECSPSGESYVFFWYGSWEQASRLVFEKIVPVLESAGISATGAVEIFNGSLPTARIGFSAAVLEKATAAIETLVATSSDCGHSSACSHDTECKVQAY